MDVYRSLAETKLQPIYAVAPFDPALTKLPLGYNGHNIVHVCNEIGAATPKKGEFETSQEHDARLRAVVDRYSGKEVYAFRIEGVVPVYDADRQV